MDSKGMLPAGICCTNCKKELDTSGDRPAERYLGTYTGLCYDCERSGEFVVKSYPDGAKQWSFPPHCPSWRRDRETYTGFGDCSDCDGKGSIWVSRRDALGGSYRVYCKACFDRFYAQPNRAKWETSRERVKSAYMAANRLYRKLTKRMAKRVTYKRANEENQKAMVKQLGAVLRNRYRTIKVKYEARHPRPAQWY